MFEKNYALRIFDVDDQIIFLKKNFDIKSIEHLRNIAYY